MCTAGYWGRFQPILKGELGFASLSQPGNGTGQRLTGLASKEPAFELIGRSADALKDSRRVRPYFALSASRIPLQLAPGTPAIGPLSIRCSLARGSRPAKLTDILFILSVIQA